MRRKQTQLDLQDLTGLIRWRLRIRQCTVVSWLYTRIDQVFLLWGWITGIIFLTPHFFPALSWVDQALFWSVLSIAGTGLMVWLAWFWVAVERLRWLIYLWSELVILGVALTDYGIFAGEGFILANLCALWLVLCAIGYGLMGFGMRSRAFLIVAGLHLATVPLLGMMPAHQFLATAMVMSGSLFLLAEVQWDMRPPTESEMLSAAQNAFNLKQQQLRASA